MRTWRTWIVGLAVLGGCFDDAAGLPGPSQPELDGAADSELAGEDRPAMPAEIGGGAGGASEAGGAVETGGTVGRGGAVGTGGAIGAGGTGVIDAAIARDGAAETFKSGEIGGPGATDGSGGAAGATTTKVTGTGGGTGGSSASGGLGGGGLDGGLGTGGVASLLDLVPRSNSIPGWTIDPSWTTAAQVAAVATTQSETEALIDGAAADFFSGPATPTMFAWQNYVNASLPSAGADVMGSALSLYLLQMPSAEQASILYASLRQSSLYMRTTWMDPTSPPIGARSRITDSGSDWWINFCKGNYYVEVLLTPSYGPPPDYAPSSPSQKKAAMDFAAAVASRM